MRTFGTNRICYKKSNNKFIFIIKDQFINVCHSNRNSEEIYVPCPNISVIVVDVPHDILSLSRNVCDLLMFLENVFSINRTHGSDLIGTV